MESGNRVLVVTTMSSMQMTAYIVTCGRGILKGELHSQYLESPFEFFDLVRMIEKMDEIYDLMDFPEAFLRPRSFAAEKCDRKKRETERGIAMNDIINPVFNDESSKSRCTFEISVRFRQNATWQGQILWVEKNLRQNFRSVLEMLKLMDEALMDGDDSTVRIEWKNGTTVS